MAKPLKEIRLRCELHENRIRYEAKGGANEEEKEIGRCIYDGIGD